MGEQGQKQWWFYGYVCEKSMQYYEKDASFFRQEIKQDMTYEKLRKVKKSQLLQYSKIFDKSFDLWICIKRCKE